jgi:TonB family protein
MLASRYQRLALATLLLFSLPGRSCWLAPAAAQTPAPGADDTVYTYVEQMPQLPGGGGMDAIVAAVQQRIVLPANAPVATSRVFVKFVVGKQGQIESAELVQATNPVIDAAVLAAVQQLPPFQPGRQGGQLVRVSFMAAITPPGLVVKWLPPNDGPKAGDENAEAQTMRRGLAARCTNEADTAFLRRVLPSSFPRSVDLLAATWRPSQFGKQLFFSVPGSEENDNRYGSELFMLDPFQQDTYAVQAFTIPSLGDATSLVSLFFADVNQDGQKELLALSECSLREGNGRETHYQTQVFQYMGLTSAGRPQYREDPTPRPYFEELDTAAKVRQALARQQRSKPPTPTPVNKSSKK